jgi:hypothetical protein
LGSNFLYFITSSSTIGIAIRYGLDGQGVGIRVAAGVNFSPLHVVQTGSGAHPADYLMGTGGTFPGNKAAGA